MDNKIIFDTKTFGKLEYFETLIYYDYPRVFACKDKNNKIYIFNEADDGEITEWWICDLESCGLKLNDLYKSNGELYYEKFSQLVYTLSYKYDEELRQIISETTIKKHVGEV